MSEKLGFIHFYEAGQTPEQPVILALHGTGGDERDLVPLARTFWPGAAILAPRGQILENKLMPRFFQRHGDDTFDLEDLKFRTAELADFIQNAATEYGFDPKNVWALGYSNGANIAASLLLSRPEILRGAILLRAMTPFEPETLVQLNGTPVFLASGRFDPIVTEADVMRLARLLRDAGAEVTLRFETGAHQLTSDELQVAREWLASQINGVS